ncbi:MAG: hypothetical protein PSX36_08390 [bacterium]|nr:hypothetical protein [bacterium]
MRFSLVIFYFTFFCSALQGQPKYIPSFVSDTMSIQGTKQVVEGDYVECVLHDLSVVRFFKTNDHKYYVRFLVTQNFYFNKVAMLEIRSGSKSSHEKDVKQFKVSKTSGMFLVEVYKNYFATYKDSGITGIVFGEAETQFTKQDANQIKKMSSFFYDAITPKK